MALDDKDLFCEHCHKMVSHRYRPSPEAGPYWRCSECGEPLIRRSPSERERDALRARVATLETALRDYLANGCECPVQEPGMHSQVCEALRAALADTTKEPASDVKGPPE
jgi:hypothetical protein